MINCSFSHLNLRHCLVNAFYPVSHCELVDDVLRMRVEVDFPAVVALGVGRERDGAALALAQVVEQVLVQARVLHVVRGNLLLAWRREVGDVDNCSASSLIILMESSNC